ncbi:hypothetical protein AB0G02_04720 [Actinosynnema sp. NPDC023658]|uniref:hypothetical protein n=1 Tax=Actinosynnema sp. NPDC023658 TaxID=3155465 RepID=UPI0033C7F469
MAARGEAQADVEVSTLVVPAWRLRWRAPELALVLGERAVALASARRDEVDRLRAETLVVFASNRMGRGVRVADRALDALKAAEAASERETAWRLRVELADSARSVGAPLTGFAAVRPVLEAEDVPPGLRATALVQAGECLVSVGRGPALSEAMDEADRLYQADPLLDHDTTLLHRGLLRASAAGQHRRWGDLRAAVAAAREGLDMVDRLKEPDTDNGQVRGRLTVELVCALLDLNKPGEASEVGTPLLERPVRAPSAMTAGWLRLALATRVHLPAGRVDQARDLLRDVADSAERHQLDTLLAESLLALAHVHEVSGDLTEALADLRSAHAAERRRARAVYAVRARLAAEFSGVHRQPAGSLHDDLSALLRTSAATTPAAAAPPDPNLAPEVKQQLRQWRPVQMHRTEGIRVKRRRAAEDMTVEGISAARAHAADRWRLVQPFGETEGDPQPQPGGRRRAPEPDAAHPETPAETPAEAPTEAAPAEARADTRPDMHSDARPEARADTASDTRTDTRPDTRPDIRSEAGADSRSEDDTPSEVRSEIRPDVRADTQQPTRADTQQPTRADTQQPIPQPIQGRPSHARSVHARPHTLGQFPDTAAAAAAGNAAQGIPAPLSAPFPPHSRSAAHAGGAAPLGGAAAGEVSSAGGPVGTAAGSAVSDVIETQAPAETAGRAASADVDDAPGDATPAASTTPAAARALGAGISAAFGAARQASAADGGSHAGAGEAGAGAQESVARSDDPALGGGVGAVEGTDGDSGESGERSVPAAGLIAAAGAVRSGRRRAAREAADDEGASPSGDSGADQSVLDTLKAAGLLDPQRAGGRRRAPDADDDVTASEAEAVPGTTEPKPTLPAQPQRQPQPQPHAQSDAETVQWRVEAPPRLRNEEPAPPVDMFDSPTMVQPVVRDDVPPVGLGAAFVKGPVIPTARVPEPPDYPMPPVSDFAMTLPGFTASAPRPTPASAPMAEPVVEPVGESTSAPEAEVRPVFPMADVDPTGSNPPFPNPFDVDSTGPNPPLPDSLAVEAGSTPEPDQVPPASVPDPVPSDPSPDVEAPATVPPVEFPAEPVEVPPSLKVAAEVEVEPSVEGSPTSSASFSPTGFLGAGDVEADEAPATGPRTGAGTGQTTDPVADIGDGPAKDPFVTAVVVGGKTIDLPAIVVEPTPPPVSESPSATRASRRHKSDLSLAELLAEALVAYEDARREDEAAGRVDEDTVPFPPVGNPTPESDNETTAPIRRVDPSPRFDSPLPPRFDTWTLPES